MSICLNRFMFTGKTRLLFSGVMCLALVVGLVACQPKQAPPSENVSDSGESQQQEVISGQSSLEDEAYAKAVMVKGPEFSEVELLTILKDIEPVSRGSMDEVVHYLSAEKGWDESRAYYVLSKVSSSEMILQDEGNRDGIAASWPEDMPTERELALVAKHRATLHKLIGYDESAGQ